MPLSNLPLVTVIIPVFNEEKYLGECLNSLSLQTYKNMEVLIVDDGSTDSSSQIMRKYPFSVYNSVHKGPGVARNFASRLAKGEILAFVDGDMFLDQNYIENLIKPITSGKAVGSYSKEEYVANKDNIWAKCWNINNNLPTNLRNIYSDNKNLVFRAILKEKFVTLKGFEPTMGYYDDHLANGKNIFSVPAKGAKCFHYNPSSLNEVFVSARWIGRSSKFPLNYKNLLKYSLINSVKISIEKIFQGAPIQFLFFKVVFDLGMSIGILFKNSKDNYSK